MQTGFRTSIAFAAALFLAPVALAAQESELPPARQLVDRHVEAIGGADAYRKHTSMRMNATLEMPAMGMRADVDIKQKQPNLMAMTMTVAGMGEIRSGFDGQVAWAVDPMQGARLLTGPELAQARDQATWDAALRSPEVVSELRTVERTKVGGQECYKVQVTWRSGRESHDCYSTETGLLVGTSMEQQSAMGTVRVETQMNDYKEFGGVKVATRVTQNMMGTQQTITLNNIEFDTVTDADVAPPEQIKALAGPRGDN